MARPLDLGDTETEDEEEEGSKPSTSKASSSKVTTAQAKKTKGPKVKKVHRPDVVDDISQTIRCYPAGEKTVGRTGIPDHLKAKRLSITSAASGVPSICVPTQNVILPTLLMGVRTPCIIILEGTTLVSPCPVCIVRPNYIMPPMVGEHT